jgi:hypothetical protein
MGSTCRQAGKVREMTGSLDPISFSVPGKVTKEHFNTSVAELSSDENLNVTQDDMPRLISWFR